MPKAKKGNPNLVKLIEELKRISYENDATLWKDIAKRLSRPLRNWAEVNISRIARYAQKGEVIIVPGKLLGSGRIDKEVTVASFGTSASARKKIEKAGGKSLSILDLARINPKGTNIKIMG